MKKKFKGGKGFTLVELLVVIVVIGTLSAIMMLSSTEAIGSARASVIFNDLRNLKTAILEWYVDNIDDVTRTDSKLTYKGSQLADFLQSEEGIQAIIKYFGDANYMRQKIAGASWEDDKYRAYEDENKLYIGYKIPEHEPRLADKIEHRAKSPEFIYSSNAPYVSLEIIKLTAE